MFVTFLCNLTLVTRNLKAKNQFVAHRDVNVPLTSRKKKQKGMGKHCSPKRMTTIYFITICKGKIPPSPNNPQGGGGRPGETGGRQREEISLFSSLNMLTMSHINFYLRNQKCRPWWRPERSMRHAERRVTTAFHGFPRWEIFAVRSLENANQVYYSVLPMRLTVPSTILAMLALPFPEFLLFHSTQHECGIFLDLFYLCIHLVSGTKLLNPSLGLYYWPIY